MRHLVSAGRCIPFPCSVSAMLTLPPVRSARRRDQRMATSGLVSRMVVTVGQVVCEIRLRDCESTGKQGTPTSVWGRRNWLASDSATCQEAVLLALKSKPAWSLPPKRLVAGTKQASWTPGGSLL